MNDFRNPPSTSSVSKDASASVAENGRGKSSFANLLSEQEERLQALLQQLSGKIFGIDSDGKPAETRVPVVLKMRFYGQGLAEVVFSVDSKRARQMPPEKLDEMIKGKTQRLTKKSYRRTNVFKGVRMFQHVRGSYSEEVEKARAILLEAEELNLSLAKRGPGEKVLSEASAALASLLAKLKAVRSIEKIAGKKKLEEAEILLEAARQEAELFRRYAFLAGACTKLVALRNRLGPLRESRIAGNDAYTILRERCMRLKRDAFILGKLGEFLTKDFSEKLRKDRELVITLQSIQEEIEYERRLGRVYPFLQVTRDSLLKIASALNNRDFESSTKLIDELRTFLGKFGIDDFLLRRLNDCREGLHNEEGYNTALELVSESIHFYSNRLNWVKRPFYYDPDYEKEKSAANYLVYAERALKEKRFKAAIASIEKAIDCLSMDTQLEYYARELEKTGDPYTAQVEEKLRLADEAFLKGDAESARAHLRDAKKLLKRI